MKCANPMRHLGSVDIGPFSAALARVPESLWSEGTEFQKKLTPYRDTITIYLQMVMGSVAGKMKYMSGWEPLHEAFEPIEKRVASFYRPGGRVVSTQVAKLLPGGKIPVHRDAGPVLAVSHRVHIPLETHKEVVFEVDGVHIPLEVGQAYELDNMRLHRVENASPVRRIHLILDYYDGGGDPAVNP